MIQRSRRFTVKVLASGDRALAGQLGKSALKAPDKLSGISYELRDGSYATLNAALSWVACEVRHTATAGDSTLVVAEVIDAGLLHEGQPLTMAEAGFRHAG